ncbi:hypothetical protein [Microbacterium suwonense]|uniref:Acetone carboxylase n=1 Tax=Microbacterium suwonense TaxID=683047 RepID=A0ABN6X0C0_9MICO|nr:hypothetical protein [Microbacterium suwonense]BDZ38112.1 hypothetical protein GCM10025863_07260 [Microbacterium suwonense]
MSGRVECARAECRAAATHHIVWRNPRIHSADRRKIWPACDEHVEFLSSYLRTRDFPVEVIEGLPE